MREAKESRWNAVEHVHKEQIRNMVCALIVIKRCSHD